MSWFSDLTSKLQEVSEQVAETAKKVIPLDKEMMEKLTLTTPEMAAERIRFDQEEKRKEHIKDCLAGMLPWETKDPERDILVEECKEAILKLSDQAETFQGPYKMPGMTVKLTESESDDEDKEGGDDEDEDDENGNKTKDKDEEEKPSEESLDKLATLEPLPKLLGEFDLDAHVGLIQRLLTEDPSLVKMQSKLSGGGEREHYFWKNYFFHCAFARYEAGLTIDEIWNDEDPAAHKAKQDADAAAEAARKIAEEAKAAQIAATTAAAADEETITFHEGDTVSTPAPTTGEAVATPNEPKKESTAADTTESSLPTDDTPVEDSVNSDFEQIGDDIIEDDEGFGDDDFELDELEAEIARELEG